MKRTLLIFSFLLLAAGFLHAQTTHAISGTLIDTTKQTVIGASVKVKTDLGDSTVRSTGLDGTFNIASIKGSRITITITSIGYQPLVRRATLASDGKPLALGTLVMKSTSTVLTGVTVVGVNPVVLKGADTTQYSAAAYKVRENAPIEDMVKKLPGVDVDKDGNVTTKGKQVTKVRINGKDVFGGDLQSITKNLPADVVESIQMIDDYGDQANLTGIKTGDPNQVMNIVIRKDRNFGYSANLTGGAGRDALPAPQKNDVRYLGLINSFKFKGDQQIYLLANLNNANANTFSFGGNSGGGGGFGGNGGGGRGNAARGGNNTASQNGITDVHTAGFNYRDQWGKNLSVYGSYSFQDNTVNTISSTLQTNYATSSTSTTNAQNSNERDNVVNHRLTWNMEWKPDTVNYLKFTPNFSYGSTITNYSDFNSTTLTNPAGITPTKQYNSTTYSNSVAPNYGVNILYNHRFDAKGRNFSAYINGGSVTTDNYQNPIYQYLLGVPTSYPNQQIFTYSRINSIGANLSYLEPLSKRSFLELSYNLNYSDTKSYKNDYDIGATLNVKDNTLSTDYNYTFTTHKVALNFRFIEQKYNYTLGLGVQPAVLDGMSPLTGLSTHITTFNLVPTARYVYNFDRSHQFNINYNGGSNQPSFNQLQPVIDFSNALYPVQGNPNLKPEFTNNLSIRYNQSSFETGNTLFFNVNLTQTDDKIVTNSITYPRLYTPNLRLSGTILSQYLNASGYYSGNAGLNFSKPWENRKYTLSVNGNVSYTNNIGYISNIDTAYVMTTQKNIGKTLTLSPGLRFRTDITDVIDAQFNTSYSVNKTDNSVKTSLTQAGSDVRAFVVGLNGKNYFWKNWTLSYDYTKTFNYGYTIPITNPNILTVYVERRFLKNNMATIRLSGNDLFNENTGYSATYTANSQTQTNVNRLGRYFLLSLNIRLQKFAGKAPDQGNGRGDRNGGDGGNGRGDRGGFGGGGRNGGGQGGPPGGF